MKTVTEHIRIHMMQRIIYETVGEMSSKTLQSLLNSEISKEFRRHQDRRMLMGAFRYGQLKKQRDIHYDCIDSIQKRLQLYVQSGNLEHLVDAANICMVEYITSQHPNKHFESSDDSIHSQQLK